MQRTIFQTTAGLAAAIGCAILLCLVSFIGLQYSRAEASLVTHTREALLTLGHLRSALQDTETGQRGYLLTGDPIYLAPYRIAYDKVGTDLADLRHITADNAEQQMRLNSLQSVVDHKLAELKETIDLYRAHQPKQALDIVRTHRGQKYMQEARHLMDAIEAEEHHLLQLRSQSAALSARVTFYFVVGGIGVLLLILLWSMRIIRKDLALRASITEALRRSEEHLATTLHSIGDAVLATDAQGCITLLNPVAEELTGWTWKQAQGKPAHEVFRILNEETRRTVESPIDKVLREGITVGLANHTILIDRSGKEHHIDDSGSPIRNGSGEVVGVILVFRNISERRHAEREIQTLNQQLQRAMTETHHRVKNNLQVLAAMIDMQMDSAGDFVPVSELERLGQNIQALGIIHDLLTREARASGQATAISARSILERLVDTLDQTGSFGKLRFSSDDVPLPGRQATALALIANELISNAIKHGRSETEITFTVEDDRATLQVGDDGPGFPAGFDPIIAAHTGLELVENIIRHDLSGKSSYTNRPQGGAQVGITFPGIALKMSFARRIRWPPTPQTHRKPPRSHDRGGCFLSSVRHKSLPQVKSPARITENVRVYVVNRDKTLIWQETCNIHHCRRNAAVIRTLLSSVFQNAVVVASSNLKKEQTMKTTLLMFGLAGALALSVAAHAQTTYDTTGSWDGSSSIQPFGNSNTATYGQTFVAPGGNLTDFTFYVNPEGSTLSMEADVFAWSGSLTGGNGPQGAVGPALYTSGPGAFVISGSGFQAVTVNTGGTPLTMGNNYVALLTVSEPSDYAATTGTGVWGEVLFNHVAGDGGGGFNFVNNGNNYAALNNGNWDDFGDFGDSAWTAHFSGAAATPEPGAYATIASLGLTGAAFLRRRRAR